MAASLVLAYTFPSWVVLPIHFAWLFLGLLRQAFLHVALFGCPCLMLYLWLCRVIGVTDLCDYPSEAANKTVVSHSCFISADMSSAEVNVSPTLGVHHVIVRNSCCHMLHCSSTVLSEPMSNIRRCCYAQVRQLLCMMHSTQLYCRHT